MKTPNFDASLGFDSVIGPITVRALNNKVTSLTIGESSTTGQSKVLQQAKKQVEQLLSGKAITVSVPYQLEGTDFQMAVWGAIAKIPFGQTTTYSELAAIAGNAKAVRAAGGAVGANPIPLLIGCHRVLGSNQKITGYSGGDGIPTKRKLLAMRKLVIGNNQL